LASSGHEILWLRLEQTGRIQESRPLAAAIQKVNWRKDQKPIDWEKYDELRDQFRIAVDQIKPDLIHAGPIQRVSYLPALIGFHPLLTMSWGFDLMEDAGSSKKMEDITRFILQSSDWFTSDCQASKNVAVSYGMEESRTTVFPWGVDLFQFNPKNRSAFRHQIGYEDDLLIVHTRSWEPRYRVNIALEGFWRALQVEPDLRLLMLGGGSQENQIKKYVEEQGLSDRVIFQGYKQNEELSKYYKAADVYLSASHIDGSSVALMEAMACGCPALISDIPANLEWVSDGKQGWIFKDNDPKDLAGKIINISRHKKEIYHLGENARLKAEMNADWSKNFARLLETYNIMMQIVK
jgi:glycosyltransferase involved in cell wall biosynthesis